eukprot:PhM_4_TR16752/c1_g2_i2/m.26748
MDSWIGMSKLRKVQLKTTAETNVNVRRGLEERHRRLDNTQERRHHAHLEHNADRRARHPVVRLRLRHRSRHKECAQNEQEIDGDDVDVAHGDEHRRQADGRDAVEQRELPAVVCVEAARHRLLPGVGGAQHRDLEGAALEHDALAPQRRDADRRLAAVDVQAAEADVRALLEAREVLHRALDGVLEQARAVRHHRCRRDGGTESARTSLFRVGGCISALVAPCLRHSRFRGVADRLRWHVGAHHRGACFRRQRAHDHRLVLWALHVGHDEGRVRSGVHVDGVAHTHVLLQSTPPHERCAHRAGAAQTRRVVARQARQAEVRGQGGCEEACGGVARRVVVDEVDEVVVGGAGVHEGREHVVARRLTRGVERALVRGRRPLATGADAFRHAHRVPDDGTRAHA